MKDERTPFFGIGIVCFAVSFVVALIIGSSPTALGVWIILVLVGLGTAFVSGGVVRLVMAELTKESAMSAAPSKRVDNP